MCLIAEIIMLLVGGYALIRGRIKVSRNLTLEGKHARITGFILATPLPLALVSGLLLGFLVTIGVLPASSVRLFNFIDVLAVAGAMLGAVLYALIASDRSKEAATPGQSQAQ